MRDPLFWSGLNVLQAYAARLNDLKVAEQAVGTIGAFFDAIGLTDEDVPWYGWGSVVVSGISPVSQRQPYPVELLHISQTGFYMDFAYVRPGADCKLRLRAIPADWWRWGNVFGSTRFMLADVSKFNADYLEANPPVISETCGVSRSKRFETSTQTKPNRVHGVHFAPAFAR